ncbi:MAG: C1 family peptidase [Prevotella sp.]|jgi:aminopeptidase C
MSTMSIHRHRRGETILVLLITVYIFFVCGCSSSDSSARDEIEFTDEVVIKTTPVKDQGRSPLCWAYAMLATIESERLMMGDSVELSVDYCARMLLKDKTFRYFFSRRQSDLSMRGMSSMLLNLIDAYGAEPYTGYYNEKPVNYNVLARKAQRVAAIAPSFVKMKQSVERLFDDNIGFLPNSVFMLGMRYTPEQFAESVCQPDEYLSLTSFTHHPFGERFVLEVADNQMRDSFMNVPIDTLMFRVERAIRNGHPVCWEGDISEPGFNFQEGWAIVMPKSSTFLNKKKEITQANRQRAFERRETTDDHCMELCGLARDRKGRKYFRAKNSWGKTGRYRGFIYLSYDYVKLKTIAFYMSKTAWNG